MALAPISTYRTEVFFAPELRGNTAFVVLLPVAPAPELTQRCLATPAANGNPETWCLCWSVANTLEVRCFAGGRMLDFCGHGLLAAAGMWHSRTGLCPTLRTAAARYESACTQGLMWLRVTRIHCQDALPPQHCTDWFGQAAQRGAVAGDAHGYRILEWPKGTDLAELNPDFNAMMRDETRAIIATQAFTPTQRRAQKYDFSLRYFAPQYGVPEDGATGSANAVLADYWAGRGLRTLQGTAFRAKQCSKHGGAVMSRLCGSFVEIGGRFHVIETTLFRLETTDLTAAIGA